ncbi:hypothetical protein [Robbsia sp. KACC 23696]|uniref:hypothetical protein n=1 Tax=Robbsia sp. KACC 23696 TaxID=3149231 RepID=UPI00325BA597
MAVITFPERKSESVFIPSLCLMISLCLGAVIALFLKMPPTDFPGVRPSVAHHVAFLIGPVAYEAMNVLSVIFAFDAISSGERHKLRRWSICQALGLTCFVVGLVLV